MLESKTDSAVQENPSKIPALPPNLGCYDYYNLNRVHRSLDGAPPARRAGGFPSPPAALAHYNWRPYCRGLFQMPLAA
jgi:hypothetical protein